MGSIRESRHTSAQAASVAIAAQRHMILDASAFRDCWPLRATLLSTPFVGSSLFGGQFQSSVEEATCSQEKLSQVRWLLSAGSRAAQGTSGSRVTQQSQKRRSVLPPLPPPTAQSVPSGDGLLAVGRASVPPSQGGAWRLSICHGTRGDFITSWQQVHRWVLPHPQPVRTQLIYMSCQVPHLYSAGSSQWLVDGVAGSQECLSACADTCQSLAVPLVCSQEPGRGAHSLSMENSPFWLSHCHQSFYQTPGSLSSTLASAGMSDLSVHRWHFPCTGVS